MHVFGENGGAQGAMKTAAGCLCVPLQSLPIERDENFGKLRRRHIPKALQPCPEVAAVPFLLYPRCSRAGRGVPGGSRGASGSGAAGSGPARLWGRSSGPLLCFAAKFAALCKTRAGLDGAGDGSRGLYLFI